MAAANKKPFSVKGINVTSPKGKALWCKYKTPDTKFNSKGEFSVSLVCDPNDPAVQAYIAKLEELSQRAYEETCETLGAAKAKAVKQAEVYSEHFDKDGEPTGMIVFKAKLKDIEDRINNNDTASIIVVDAARNKLPLHEQPEVGNDSVIRLATYANPYYMASTKTVGISHIWTKMQIIDLVSMGAEDEFEEEDGFEADSSACEDDAPQENSGNGDF